MVRHALSVLAAVTLSCCICLGVFWGTQSHHGVAVVDLDEVSRQLGQQSAMQQSLQVKTEQTKQKLAAIEQDAASQLEEARRALGEKPTAEEAQKFQRMQQSAIAQLTQLKQKAEQEVAGHRQQLVSQFREQARPIVARVAKEHGFGTVMTRNEMFLFSYEQAVDITAQVAREMTSATTSAAAQPAWPAPAKDVPQPAAQPVIQQVQHEAPAKK